MFLLFSVPPGYLITYNATEYEFDVNVYSPIGTVVFEALLVAENISDFLTIIFNFAGAAAEFGPYSINEMDTQVTFDISIEINPLLTIRLDEALNPQDGDVIYEFTIDYIAAGAQVKSDSVNVILHEVGKLLAIVSYIAISEMISLSSKLISCLSVCLFVYIFRYSINNSACSHSGPGLCDSFGLSYIKFMFIGS